MTSFQFGLVIVLFILSTTCIFIYVENRWREVSFKLDRNLIMIMQLLTKNENIAEEQTEEQINEKTDMTNF